VPVFEYYLLTAPVVNPQLLKVGGKVFCRKPKYQDSILRWYYEQKGNEIQMSTKALIPSSYSHCKLKIYSLLRNYEEKEAQ
jgi:hypothetical protein